MAQAPVENPPRIHYNPVIAIENRSQQFVGHVYQRLWVSVVYLPIPLIALRPGEYAEIQQVAGSDDHVRRLEELGLRSGAILAMVRGGSPCIIRLGGSTLCFRDDELTRVMVAPRKSA